MAKILDPDMMEEDISISSPSSSVQLNPDMMDEVLDFIPGDKVNPDGTTTIFSEQQDPIDFFAEKSWENHKVRMGKLNQSLDAWNENQKIMDWTSGAKPTLNAFDDITLLEGATFLYGRTDPQFQQIVKELKNRDVPMQILGLMKKDDESFLESAAQTASSDAGAIIFGEAGQKIGGAMGHPVWGRIIGTGVGAVLGTFGNRAVQEKYFPEKASMRSKYDMLVNTGANVGMEAAQGPGFKVAKWFINPSKGIRTGADAISNAVETTTESLTPKSATKLLGSETLDRVKPIGLMPHQAATGYGKSILHNVLSKSFTSGGLMQEADMVQQAAVESMTKKVVDQLGENVYRSTDPAEFSLAIKDAIEEGVGVNKSRAISAYQKLDTMLSGSPQYAVSRQNIKDYAQSVLDKEAQGLLNAPLQQDTKDVLTYYAKSMQPLTNFTEAKTSFRGEIKRFSTDSSEQLKSHLGKIEGLMDDSVKGVAELYDASNPGGKATKLLGAADRVYASSSAELEERAMVSLLRQIDDSKGEILIEEIAKGNLKLPKLAQARDILLRNTGKSTQQLSRDRKVWNTIESGIAENTIKASRDAKTGLLDYGKLSGAIKKLEDSGVAGVVFTDKAKIDALKNIRTTMEYMGKTGGESGSVFMQMMQAGGVATAVGAGVGYFSGNQKSGTEAGVTAGVAFLFGPRYLARVYLDPDFARWARNGIPALQGKDMALAGRTASELMTRYLRTSYKMYEQDVRIRDARTKTEQEQRMNYIAPGTDPGEARRSFKR
jgi:hypothetical protein